MSRQVRAIPRLAQAMEKFGKGRDLGDFRVTTGAKRSSEGGFV